MNISRLMSDFQNSGSVNLFPSKDSKLNTHEKTENKIVITILPKEKFNEDLQHSQCLIEKSHFHLPITLSSNAVLNCSEGTSTIDEVSKPVLPQDCSGGCSAIASSIRISNEKVLDFNVCRFSAQPDPYSQGNLGSLSSPESLCAAVKKISTPDLSIKMGSLLSLFDSVEEPRLSSMDKLQDHAINLSTIKGCSPTLIGLSEGSDDIKPNSCSLIVFDLETSGLGVHESEILQIGAVWKESKFSCYISPTKAIGLGATRVNHLEAIDGVLFYKGEPVNSFTLENVLDAFLEWLKSIPPPRILIGHNIRKFDCPHLFNAICKCDLVKKYCSTVVGFIDTLPLFKDKFKGMSNYRQNTLVQNILKTDYEQHNALGDVQALQKLIFYSKFSNDLLLKHSFTSNSMWRSFCYDQYRKTIYDMYCMMIDNGGISKGMAHKFSKNGLAYSDLNAAYRNGGRKQLEQLLGAEVSGSVRGTRSKSVIDGIVNYFEKSK